LRIRPDCPVMRRVNFHVWKGQSDYRVVG
jgi:hypothetical protein